MPLHKEDTFENVRSCFRGGKKMYLAAVNSVVICAENHVFDSVDGNSTTQNACGVPSS
jgi:hypothetical protein